MKLVIKIGGRWKNDRKVEKLFRLYAERAEEIMLKLSKELRFRLPKQIILRPFYFKGGISMFNGRLLYDPCKGYSIALSVPHCIKMKDKGIWVLDHECSHVAAAIKHKDWGHGENFKRIYAACRKKIK